MVSVEIGICWLRTLKRKIFFGVIEIILLMEKIILFSGFIHPRWLFGISEPSTVEIKALKAMA